MPKYRKATLEDLKTAKVVYHRNDYHMNVYSPLTLDYDSIIEIAKKVDKRKWKELSDRMIKDLKNEVYEYFKEGKIYIKE